MLSTLYNKNTHTEQYFSFTIQNSPQASTARKLDIIEGWIEGLHRRGDVIHEAHSSTPAGALEGAWLIGEDADALTPWAARWLIHEGASLGLAEGRWWLDSRKTLASLADTLPLLRPVAVRVCRGESEVVVARARRGWCLSFNVVGDEVEVVINYLDELRLAHQARAVIPALWLWITPQIAPPTSRVRA